MRELDGLGVFWIPAHEEDVLSGHLRFDPKGDGITLSLVGTFNNVPGGGRGEPQPRIVGWLGDEKVTLDRCFVLETKIRGAGIAESKYYVNRMFIGHHFGLDRLEFQSAIVALRDLDSWVDRSGIAEEHYLSNQGPSDMTYKMTFTPLPEESHSFSRGRTALDHTWKSAGDPVHGISFQQSPVIRIEYKQIQPFDVIHKDVNRIQNLVSLCIDAPTAIDGLILKRPDVPAETFSGEDSRYQQAVEFLAPPLRYIEPQEYKPRHWHQMLLSYEELGGIASIARWLDVSQRFQRALDSFMSIKHAKQMFAENRFLNVTFAAEAFHRTTQHALHMDEQTFAQLLSVYLENTPVEYHDWLYGRIRNEPTLGKRLQRLATRSGNATSPLIGEKGRWAHTISQVRNELSHLGTNSLMFDAGDLIFLTESVYAVVRICMLMECGAPSETLTKKANSPTITWYRERLKDATARVRSQLASD